ncbi:MULTISPECIES: hypothetical protein [Calothrix]|nr:hypothetical protein [Calothrix parietina]
MNNKITPAARIAENSPMPHAQCPMPNAPCPITIKLVGLQSS